MSNQVNLEDIDDIEIKGNVKIVEQQEDDYITFRLKIDGRKSEVEVKMDKFKELIVSHGWWFKGGTHTNDPQAYRTYVLTFDKYKSANDENQISTIIGKLQNIIIDKDMSYRRPVQPNDINNPDEYPSTNNEVIKLLKKLEKEVEA